MLSSVIGSEEMSKYLKEEGYIRLIQCFLQPSLMLQRPELSKSQSWLQVGEASGQLSAPADPIYQLFMPHKPDQQGILRFVEI